MLQDETSKNVVLTAIRIARTLNFNLEPKDINACHRMKTRNQNLPPLFVIQFVCRHVKATFMREAIKMKPTTELFGGNRNNKIYINDELVKRVTQVCGRKAEEHRF